jgi:hypothetical protein
MIKLYGLYVVILCVTACALDAVETSTAEQAGAHLQGAHLQGAHLQGAHLQGAHLQGFRFDGATLGGSPLANLRVEQGELVAEQGQVTLRGAALAGAQLQAEVLQPASSPEATLVQYRIANIALEDSSYDPTNTGATFLYTLEQWVDDDASWQPVCSPDQDGRQVAIPVAATWNEHGDRVESSALFTFGCTTGVIAKCYRWGYRPWLTGYGEDMAVMHQTCTRMARADYCGDGVPHTQDGTWINNWDLLPAPGPIQSHGVSPLGMVFEAGWDPDGAVCLSHARWLAIGSLLANVCPNRIIPLDLGGITCDSAADVLWQRPAAKMFNESYVNIGLW